MTRDAARHTVADLDVHAFERNLERLCGDLREDGACAGADVGPTRMTPKAS